MKRFALAVLLSGIAILPGFAQDIGGNYAVSGTNLDGSHYKGTATITIKTSTTCEIVWHTGATDSVGICMRNDSSFAAAYKLGADVGLVIYKTQSDGTLDGLWTIAGQEGNGTEVLTPAN